MFAAIMGEGLYDMSILLNKISKSYQLDSKKLKLMTYQNQERMYSNHKRVFTARSYGVAYMLYHQKVKFTSFVRNFWIILILFDFFFLETEIGVNIL